MWQRSMGSGGAEIIHCYPVVWCVSSLLERAYVRYAASLKQDSHKSADTLTTTQQLLSELFRGLFSSSKGSFLTSPSVLLFPLCSVERMRNGYEGGFIRLFILINHCISVPKALWACNSLMTAIGWKRSSTLSSHQFSSNFFPAV